MSHIDVHEIKLNLRYPNSRQEDITDAFMRGYQGAVKIGNDAVRRVKAEKAALEARIDELCAEVERSKAEFKKMDVWHSQELKAAMDENAKLREFIKLKQTCWKYAGWCHSCPYNGIDEDHADCNCTVQEEVEKMARELGIEGECAKS